MQETKHHFNHLYLRSELEFKASRSGGKGGQHVNKVSTKVELKFDIENSKILTAQQKERLLDRLKNRINKEDVLYMSCDTERSQLANKKKVVERFYQLLEKSLKIEKPRKPTRPTKSSKEKRISKKKKHSEKKKLRSQPEISPYG